MFIRLGVDLVSFLCFKQAGNSNRKFDECVHYPGPIPGIQLRIFYEINTLLEKNTLLIILVLLINYLLLFFFNFSPRYRSHIDIFDL